MKNTKDEIKAKIGKYIIDLLTKPDMTKSSIAKRLAVSAGRLSNIIVGRELPSVEFLINLAELGGTTVDAIVRGEENGQKNQTESKISVSATGRSAVAAGRDAYVNTTVRKTHEYIPGPEDITAEQAARLQFLVNQIVDLEKKIMKRPKTHGAVWSLLKRKFKVTYYREIKRRDFEEAEIYLTRNIGRLKRSLRSIAPDSWRSLRVRAIQTKRKQIKWPKEDFINFLMGHYSVESIKDLTDDQIEELYQLLFSSKTK